MHPHPSDPSKASFGLVAWLEATRVVLPLKGVECRFQVTGAIASVELDQIYHQGSDRPLDCTYTFPLPAGAAVHRCELHVNGRVIRARVEERGAALKLQREHKAAGRRTALVETERENLFTLSLGNVQPGDVILVRFAWFQVLDRVGRDLRLRVPTCPGVRYIPGQLLLRGLSGRGTADDTDQVPDASRLSPTRIDALHPDAAYFYLQGLMDCGDVAAGTLTSPSHPIGLREGDGKLTVSLPVQGAIPDRDLVLVWQEPPANQLVSRAWCRTESDATYALAQLRAPEVVQTADEFSQDFYFLVDRSGSMAGAKWQRTCAALRAFVGLLGPKDRVAITLFESNFRDYAEGPLAASWVFTDPGFQKLEQLGTAGGTELLPAVRHVLQQLPLHSGDRRTTAVLITDGEVGNESAVIQAFAQAPALKVHTFGIDTTVNDAFLKNLAQQQRGGCWLQTPNDDIAGTVAALGAQLRRPVLTDLSVRGGGWETGRTSCPDLHAQGVVMISLRGPAPSRLEISGRLPDGQEHRFPLLTQTTTNDAIQLLWARERIAGLLLAGRRDEAIALAKKHNLLCEGAAFIAWDEAEQVAIADEELIQPAMEPAHYRSAGICALYQAPNRVVEFQKSSYLAEPDDPRVGGYHPPLASDIPVDQHILRLWTTMTDAGVNPVRIEAFTQWAVANGRLDRLSALTGVMSQLTKMSQRLYSRMNHAWVDSMLDGILAGPIEKLDQRLDLLVHRLDHTNTSLRTLAMAGAPSQIVIQIGRWALDPNEREPDRFVQLRPFAVNLVRRNVSADGTDALWQVLVDRRSGAPTINLEAAQNYISARAPRAGWNDTCQ